MSGQTLALGPGLRVVYDGDLVEVVELDGARVVLRNDRTGGVSAVQLARLVALARAGDPTPGGDGGASLAVVLSGLTEAQRAVVAERAGHVREVLTGYRAGHPDGATAREPRSQFDAGCR